MENNGTKAPIDRAPISETALTKKLLDFYSFILCVLCATWLIKTFIERKYPAPATNEEKNPPADTF